MLRESCDWLGRVMQDPVDDLCLHQEFFPINRGGRPHRVNTGTRTATKSSLLCHQERIKNSGYNINIPLTQRRNVPPSPEQLNNPNCNSPGLSQTCDSTSLSLVTPQISLGQFPHSRRRKSSTTSPPFPAWRVLSIPSW